MQNLVLDFGNTLIKAASFKGNELISKKSYSNSQDLLLDIDFINNHHNCIIASVTQDHEVVLNSKDFKPNQLLFTSATPLPIKNLYESKATLGSDRLAASIGAFSIKSNANVLTVDCGTCIKYNFVNTQNEYLGGGISPGMKMRFTALHEHTAKLPLVEIPEHFNQLIGKNTADSIASGVINGCTNEIDGIINEYHKSYNNLTVFVTGGDGDFFAKRLKNSIFANPDLLIIGLNTILNFNLEKN